MCRMFIFVKIVKITIFKHFFDVLFELFKNPSLHPNH